MSKDGEDNRTSTGEADQRPIVREAKTSELGFDPTSPYLGRPNWHAFAEQLVPQGELAKTYAALGIDDSPKEGVLADVCDGGIFVFLDVDKRAVQSWLPPQTETKLLRVRPRPEARTDRAAFLGDTRKIFEAATAGDLGQLSLRTLDCSLQETVLRRPGAFVDPAGFGTVKIVEGNAPLTLRTPVLYRRPGFEFGGELARVLQMLALPHVFDDLRSPRNQLAPGQKATDGPTEVPTTDAANPPDLLSAPDLARHLDRPVAQVESFLRRYRDKYPDCFREVEGARRNEPRFLYRTAVVLPALRKSQE